MQQYLVVEIWLTEADKKPRNLQIAVMGLDSSGYFLINLRAALRNKEYILNDL